MAKILSVTSGYPSILYPSLELARRLAAAGHRLTFAGLAESRALVEHHGLKFLPLTPSRYGQFLEEDARMGTLERLWTLRRRRERAVASMEVQGFAEAVRDLAPDLVLIDGEMHEHIIAASAAGPPIALLNSFSSIWRRPGLPPAHALVRPGVGFRGSRLGICLLWLALRLRKKGRAVSLWLRRLGCDQLSILRFLALDAGFDLRRETDAGQWLMPFTYRHFPVLSLHAREFEFSHDPPAGVRYVGPMLLDSRIDRSMSEADRGRLDAILAAHGSEGERRGEGRRLIYAGFGATLSADLDFLRSLLRAVEERPRWDLILSLSGRVDPSTLGRLRGELAERVHVFDWVPQRRVLEHADVVVTHGGINTLDECVTAGVPVLVYCGFETDMAGNTARVVHHGIGIAGDRRRDRTSAIRGHLDRLLSEPSFVDSVERLRRSYLAYGEERVAERAVDELLAGSSSQRADLNREQT